MTVHGAKGLEAPIVILPDTTTTRDVAGRAAARRPRTAASCGRRARPTTARPRAGARTRRELAVDAGEPAAALRRPDPGARPADRLRGQAERPARSGSWYDVVERGASTRPEIAAGSRGPLEGDGADPLRRRPRASAACRRRRAVDRRRCRPGRAGLRPPRRRSRATPRPRTLAEARRGPAPSPLAAPLGLGRFRRGEPDPPPAAAAAGRRRRPSAATRPRRAAGARARPRPTSSAPRWRPRRWRCWTTRASPPCSAPARGAEVALAGAAARLPAGLAVSGRVDRLLVEAPTACWWSTSRPTARRRTRIEDADPAYVRADGGLWARAAARSSRAARSRRRWSGPTDRS